MLWFSNNTVVRIKFIDKFIYYPETDPDGATKLWRQIFGDQFPKTEVSKSESLLATAVTPSTLTFPDRPITPNKPKGFA